MNRDEALTALQALVDEGWMIGVEVFGEDDCCLHGEDADCPSAGWGLMDTMHTPHSVGSDCNRAVPFMMRPHDDLMVESIRNGIADNWVYGP